MTYFILLTPIVHVVLSLNLVVYKSRFWLQNLSLYICEKKLIAVFFLTYYDFLNLFFLCCLIFLASEPCDIYHSWVWSYSVLFFCLSCPFLLFHPTPTLCKYEFGAQLNSLN